MTRATLFITEIVLREQRKPMRAAEIVTAAGHRMRRYTAAFDPERVVRRDLALAIRGEPECKFVRVAEGLFALRDCEGAPAHRVNGRGG